MTIFTRSSVHWAERIVAISSSNGVSCTRAQVAVRIFALQKRDDLAGVLLALRDGRRASCVSAAGGEVAVKLSPQRLAVQVARFNRDTGAD